MCIRDREGGLASRPENVILYATSNRRHLLRETFADRDGDEVHHADTVQESVSLSDRFGISLTFLLPDKPVSYTHLDVYKRQSKSCSCGGSIIRR